MIIAIDGPAGSGKTTIAKLLAKKLGIHYLDTGAMYRALTLAALDTHTQLSDPVALRALALSIEIRLESDKVYLNGKEVSQAIRAPVVDKSISVVVAHPEVRSIMVDLQRVIARESSFVVEGRDITTVVFPGAEYKFYLDADPSIRAQRRFKELEAKGTRIDFKEMQDDLDRRDLADRSRKVGALQRSPDAYFIDTTNLSIDEVVCTMWEYIRSGQSKQKKEIHG